MPAFWKHLHGNVQDDLCEVFAGDLRQAYVMAEPFMLHTIAQMIPKRNDRHLTVTLVLVNVT